MRKYVILAEGNFTPHSAKTALGVLRFAKDETVAVIDSEKAGQDVSSALHIADIGNGIPVVSSIDEAFAYKPTSLLIGIAPIGGKLPESWQPILLRALELGLEIVSGLHFFLNDDPELTAAAQKYGSAIWDVRKPQPQYAMRIGQGKSHRKGSNTIFMAGSDCNVGKMTAALVMEQTARQRGHNTAFAATGQTGIMIAGEGVPTDRIISDFVNGAVEWLLLDLTNSHDWVFVEGQGSLCHPAYSAVTMGLLHGARPDMQILCHEANRGFIYDYPAFPIPPLKELIIMYETAARWLKPAPIVGVSLNTFSLSEDEARTAIEKATAETGLPVTDPVRFGADALINAIESAAK